jgi:hypothetical protein
VLRECLTSPARHRAAAFTRQIGQPTTSGAEPASLIAALAAHPRPAPLIMELAAGPPACRAANPMINHR